MKSILAFTAVSALLATASAQETPQPKLQPVPLKSGSVTLAPANSRIDFVGTHEGAKPDPRKGGFASFSGRADFSDDGALQTISFDIDTRSLHTEIGKLTAHLKSPDFFDVRQHPKASFQSTSVTPADKPGSFDVTGKFTLLGTTKTVRLPVTVAADSAGVTLVSKFSFDRTQFGMTYGEGKVKKKVNVTVLVGQATQTPRQ